MTKLSPKESFVLWITLLDRFIFSLMDWLTIALSLAISVAVVATVFARYVLNDSFSWGEELPGLLLVCLTFLGSAWLSRYNGHLAFDGLTSTLPSPLSKVVQTVNLLLIQFFLVAFTYYGWIITLTTGQTKLVTLNWPQALFRAVIPLSGLVMLFAFGREIFMVWISSDPPSSISSHGDEVHSESVDEESKVKSEVEL